MVCTVDKKDGEIYKDCVMDYFKPGDCALAIELHDLGKDKHSCKYWVESHDRQQSTNVDIEANLNKWINYSDDEMRLHAGELTAQEIHSIRAVLNCIINNK